MSRDNIGCTVCPACGGYVTFWQDSHGFIEADENPHHPGDPECDCCEEPAVEAALERIREEQGFSRVAYGAERTPGHAEVYLTACKKLSIDPDPRIVEELRGGE